MKSSAFFALRNLDQSGSRLRVLSVTATLLMSGLALAPITPPANAAAPTSPSPSMHLTPEQMRGDLVYLRDVFGAKDKSYSPDEHKQFDSIIDRAIDHVSRLSTADFALTILRAVALSHNGHTNANAWMLLHVMPIRLWWFSDGLYVVKAEPAFADLLGARVERFGPLAPDEAVKRISPYISGHSEWIRFLSPFWLVHLEALHRIGASASDREATLTLRLRNGTTRTITLGAQTAPDPDTRTGALSTLSPEPKGLAGRWLQVLDGKHIPRVYRAPVDLSGEMIGKDNRVLYVRSDFIDENVAEKAGKTPFLDKVYNVLNDLVVKQRPKNVIVDLRFNTGGNFFNTLLFDDALPKLLPPDGHIYILVNRVTFSAALVTAARLKYLSKGKALLVGEPMGDDGAFWAEGRWLKLPNSHITLQYASQFEDWSKGCHDLDKCYWPSVAFGVNNVSLAPDVPVSVSFADYAAGRDPVLERALELAQ